MTEVNGLAFMKELMTFCGGDKRSEKRCQEIVGGFAKSCVDVAWHLRILPVRAGLDEKQQRGSVFDPALHERHSLSDTKSINITAIMWPSLFSFSSPRVCLFKGIVMTRDVVDDESTERSIIP